MRLMHLASRFDYSQWMQQAAGGDEDVSATIHTLMSTYDIFHKLRNSALEDVGSMGTFPCAQRRCLSGHGLFDSVRMEDPTYFYHCFDNVHGQDCTSVVAGRLVLESASEMMYDHREEELVRLNDGRMTLIESYENTCDTFDDLAENFAAEGMKGMR